MKHIHFVEPYHSHAMQRMALRIADYLKDDFHVTIGDGILEEADLTYHVPWHSIITEKPLTGKHVVLYTHLNPGQEDELYEACEIADQVVCMAYQGRKELIDLGIDPKKIWVSLPGADEYMMKAYTVGIVGSEQPNARKRTHLLLDILWNMDFWPFHFLVVGRGWDDVVDKAQKAGARVSYTDMVTADTVQELYLAMDVLLVTGYVEGGPLPMIEAMASGVDVLAPEIGFAADILPRTKLYTNIEDLCRKLQNLVRPKLELQQSAKIYSWGSWADDHLYLFCKLLGVKVPQIGNRGMARYTQLLDIVEETMPESILEVGTWNGDRASQMIQIAQRKHEEVKYYGYDIFGTITYNRQIKHAPNAPTVNNRLRAAGARVTLHQGDTKKMRIAPPEFIDFVFIDGGHDFETVLSDWDQVSKFAEVGTTVIFDDYIHEGEWDEKNGGVNMVVDGIDKKQWKVTHLPVRTTHDNETTIGMVRVERRA